MSILFYSCEFTQFIESLKLYNFPSISNAGAEDKPLDVMTSTSVMVSKGIFFPFNFFTENSVVVLGGCLFGGDAPSVAMPWCGLWWLVPY